MWWLFGLLAVCAALNPSQARAFEGDVDAKSIGGTAQGDVAMTIAVSAKGDIRMDIITERVPGETTVVSYIKPAAGKYDYMLDREQRQALKVLKTTLEGAAPLASASTEADVEIEALGGATVAGQATRHMRITDKTDGQVSELWVSDRYPAGLWRSALSTGGGTAEGPMGPWLRAAEPQVGFKPGLIMKMLSTDELGRTTGFEVTRVRVKKVPADRFTIPADYQVILLPDSSGANPVVERPSSQGELEPVRQESPRPQEGLR